jgi:hypothetical protein
VVVLVLAKLDALEDVDEFDLRMVAFDGLGGVEGPPLEPLHVHVEERPVGGHFRREVRAGLVAVAHRPGRDRVLDREDLAADVAREVVEREEGRIAAVIERLLAGDLPKPTCASGERPGGEHARRPREQSASRPFHTHGSVLLSYESYYWE